jgi:hypothetical protein
MFHPRAVLNLPNLCILVWVLVLLWGERWVFSGSIAACEWAGWENWVSFPESLGVENGMYPHTGIMLMQEIIA